MKVCTVKGTETLIQILYKLNLKEFSINFNHFFKTIY